MQTLLLDRRTQDMIEGYVPEGEVLTALVRFFSIFADSTRLRILSALAISEMCVTDISRVLGINQTTVSHQLRFLKDAGMVRTDRHGKIIFYSLSNEIVNDVLLKGVEFLGYSPSPGGGRGGRICARPAPFRNILCNRLKIARKACIMNIWARASSAKNSNCCPTVRASIS